MLRGFAFGAFKLEPQNNGSAVRQVIQSEVIGHAPLAEGHPLALDGHFGYIEAHEAPAVCAQEVAHSALNIAF
jgi:hypothetical protein